MLIAPLQTIERPSVNINIIKESKPPHAEKQDLNDRKDTQPSVSVLQRFWDSSENMTSKILKYPKI